MSASSETGTALFHLEDVCVQKGGGGEGGKGGGEGKEGGDGKKKEWVEG